MADRQQKLHPPIGYEPIVHWAMAQRSPGKCSISTLEQLFPWVAVRRVFTSALIVSAVVLKIGDRKRRLTHGLPETTEALAEPIALIHPIHNRQPWHQPKIPLIPRHHCRTQRKRNCCNSHIPLQTTLPQQ